MNRLKSFAVNTFLKSKKGNETFAQIKGLTRFGHFGEAACLARHVLDENSASLRTLPQITSYERKLLVGSYYGNKQKAKEHDQVIPDNVPK